MSLDVILDNHMHLRRDGRFLDAVRDFRKHGGTHLILAQYPMPEIVVRDMSYMKLYHDTIKMAREVIDKTSVNTYVTIGPYPVDYLYFMEKLGREGAKELMKRGMEEAVTLCLENELCVGIGEIGRPHFDVDTTTLQDSNEIMVYGLECARDHDLPVILHTEKTTTDLCKEIAEIADKVGLSRDRVIKHFSPPLIKPEENHGLVPSVLSTWRNLREAINKGDRFLMETDYIDDPKRPGAVLDLTTVPRYTRKLLDEDLADEDTLYKIHKELPERIYDIEID